MSYTGIDLFAGGGGTTLGAKGAGVNIIWAANHKKAVVEAHEMNHPETDHACQDLQQADWSQVPKHDILFASPCCQGHSDASGLRKKTIYAYLSRSTAWAVVSCLEAHRSPVAIIENIERFLDWALFPAWKAAMSALNYSISINVVNAADLGIPQSRVRLFIVATQSKNPIQLDLPKHDHKAATSFLDLNFDNHEWDLVENRVDKTKMRVKNGRADFGEVFLDAAYGTERSGRSIHKPLGTVTTVNKHSLVMGDYIRPLTIKELAAAQTFPHDYYWPKGKTITKEMIGNAVPPEMSKKMTLATLQEI